MFTVMALASFLFPYSDFAGRDVDGWNVYHQADGTCGIEGELDELKVVMLANASQPQGIIVGVGNQSWTNIVQGRRYEVQVWIRNKLVQTQATGMVGPGGVHFVLAGLPRRAVFESAGHDLKFVYGGKTLAEVAPRNAEPISAMIECTQTGADPFAKSPK